MLVGGPDQTLLVVHSDIKILRSPGVAISSRRADLDDLKQLSGRTRVRPGARKPVAHCSTHFEPRQPDPHQYGNVRLPRTVSMHAERASTATACSVSYPLRYEASRPEESNASVGF